MKNAGHREAVQAALEFDSCGRTPVNNFAVVTAARYAGVTVDKARWDPAISAKVAVDYSLKTESDFVKPVLDSQIPLQDMGMNVKFPEDDYGSVPGHIVETPEDVDKLHVFDPDNASECPGFTKVRRPWPSPRTYSPRTCTSAASPGGRSPPRDTSWGRRT